jgi:hypothetical protein
VKRVLGKDGQELAFSHRYGELVVDLGASVQAGSTVELRVETGGEFFTAAGGNRGDNFIDLYLVDWYPIPWVRYENRFTAHAVIRTKKPFRPLASGDTVKFTEEGDRYVLETKRDTPGWDFCVFAGKYKLKELQDGGMTVRVHAYALGDDEELEKIAGTTMAFAKIYGQMFGPANGKELDVVEIPTLSFFGISPSGVVLLTSRTFKPADPQLRDWLGNAGVNALIAHEVAY